MTSSQNYLTDKYFDIYKFHGGHVCCVKAANQEEAIKRASEKFGVAEIALRAVERNADGLPHAQE